MTDKRLVADMARDTRKSAISGVFPPLERFDIVDRRHCGHPKDRVNLPGLVRCMFLKAEKASIEPAPSIRTNFFLPIHANHWAPALNLDA